MTLCGVRNGGKLTGKMMGESDEEMPGKCGEPQGKVRERSGRCH